MAFFKFYNFCGGYCHQCHRGYHMIMYIGIAALLGILFWSWKNPRAAGSVVWALITTMALGAALLVSFPTHLSQLALWLTVFVPVIWVGFSFWCYFDNISWRPLSGMVLITMISAIVLIISDPII